MRHTAAHEHPTSIDKTDPPNEKIQSIPLPSAVPRFQRLQRIGAHFNRFRQLSLFAEILQK